MSVEGAAVGEIGHGFVILAGVEAGDDAGVAQRLAAKIAEMRIFSDEAGRFDRSLIDTGGAALVVSQFTLLADIRRGRRPSFIAAAPPDVAAPVIDELVNTLRKLGVRVATGTFGAHMSVELVNDGPVTIVMDSAEIDRPRRS